eukprot:Clim_evm24s240 gene=Clim_evmTU24s240
MAAAHSTSPQSRVLSIAYNDSGSHFCLGLQTGFAIYHAMDLKLVQYRNIGRGIGQVAMCGTSNVLAVSGGGHDPVAAPSKVLLWDDAIPEDQATGYLGTSKDLQGPGGNVRAIIGFREHVTHIKFASKTRLLCSTRHQVFVYGLSQNGDDLTQLRLYDSGIDLAPLFVCSATLVCFPGRNDGHVLVGQLSDRKIKQPYDIIAAHQSPVARLCLNSEGTVLATASVKGTIIRLFHTPSRTRIREFRRGMDMAMIHSLAFSPGMMSLVALSDKGTGHIFTLLQAPEGQTHGTNRDPQCFVGDTAVTAGKASEVSESSGFDVVGGSGVETIAEEGSGLAMDFESEPVPLPPATEGVPVHSASGSTGSHPSTGGGPLTLQDVYEQTKSYGTELLKSLAQTSLDLSKWGLWHPTSYARFRLPLSDRDISQPSTVAVLSEAGSSERVAVVVSVTGVAMQFKYQEYREGLESGQQAGAASSQQLPFAFYTDLMTALDGDQ